uniref:Uncharacterized protein n=1 Tax=Panagrolaimus sp. JU765 TaxID=591449 RepID=A0AC34QYP3_9BILA
MSTTSLRSTLSRASLEKLIQPAQAKKEIRQVVEDAIEQAAQTILALPRKKRRETRRTEKTGGNVGGKEVKPVKEGKTREIDSPRNEKVERFEPKSPPGRRKKKIVAKDGIDAGINGCDDSRCECGAKTIPLPISHGVLPEEPLIFRDRYFECNGTAMYTREIYSSNGTKMKIDKKKLAHLRGLPANSPKMLSSRSPASESDKAGKSPEDLDKKHSKSPIGEVADNKIQNIIVKDVDKNAKGMALTLKVTVLKSNGDQKQVELVVEMPDFEPTCVKYGKKTAFFE